MSWRTASGQTPQFAPADGDIPKHLAGWRIPVATWKFISTRGVIAGGPGGAYISPDGEHWNELPLWSELETGAADYLHAYWMGRYYHFVPPP
jgi:hypothetical protein